MRHRLENAHPQRENLALRLIGCQGGCEMWEKITKEAGHRLLHVVFPTELTDNKESMVLAGRTKLLAEKQTSTSLFLPPHWIGRMAFLSRGFDYLSTEGSWVFSVRVAAYNTQILFLETPQMCSLLLWKKNKLIWLLAAFLLFIKS